MQKTQNNQLETSREAKIIEDRIINLWKKCICYWIQKKMIFILINFFSFLINAKIVELELESKIFSILLSLLYPPTQWFLAINHFFRLWRVLSILKEQHGKKVGIVKEKGKSFKWTIWHVAFFQLGGWKERKKDR